MSRSTAKLDEDGVRAARKTLRILEMLATGKDFGVTEISRATEMSKPRAFRYLRTLVSMGYAVQLDGSDRYARGAKLLALTRVVGQSAEDSLIELGRPALQSLHDQFEHTFNLSVVYGDSVSIVESLPGKALVGITLKLNELMPLHCTAAGKLLLADRQRKNSPFPAFDLHRFTKNTVIDLAELEEELREITRCGWAQAPEQVVLGINAVSVPVYDHGGQLVAMLSAMDSIQFIPEEPSKKLVAALKEGARAMEARLSL